jgi:hypothetical protein
MTISIGCSRFFGSVFSVRVQVRFEVRGSWFVVRGSWFVVRPGILRGIRPIDRYGDPNLNTNRKARTGQRERQAGYWSGAGN